jgi:hypothetical protein
LTVTAGAGSVAIDGTVNHASGLPFFCVSEAGLPTTEASGGPWLDLADPWRSMGIAVGGPGVHRLLVPRQASVGSSR